MLFKSSMHAYRHQNNHIKANYKTCSKHFIHTTFLIQAVKPIKSERPQINIRFSFIFSE